MKHEVTGRNLLVKTPTKADNFNDALYDFGWKSLLSIYYDGKKILNHATDNPGHDDHLHLQGYNPSISYE